MSLLNKDNIFVFDYSNLKKNNTIDEIKKMFNFLNINLEESHQNIIKSILSYQSHSIRKPDTIGKKFSTNHTKNFLTQDDLQIIKSDQEIKEIGKEILTRFSIKVT